MFATVEAGDPTAAPRAARAHACDTLVECLREAAAAPLPPDLPAADLALLQVLSPGSAVHPRHAMPSCLRFAWSVLRHRCYWAVAGRELWQVSMSSLVRNPCGPIFQHGQGDL